MIENYRLTKLDWDTEFFGTKSCRVELNKELMEHEREDLLIKLKDYEFITIVNNQCNNKNNLWLSELNNCFLVDINVQYHKKVDHEAFLTDLPKEDNSVLLSTGIDIRDQLIDIAYTSFTYSRFYNDPYLSKEKSRNVYVEWVKSSINSEFKKFCVFKQDNKILGFLLFSVHEKQAKIELIAVDNNVKNKGIGKKMFQYFFNTVKKDGVEKIILGTQINNINANNFYISCGFSMTGNSSIFHLWK